MPDRSIIDAIEAVSTNDGEAWAHVMLPIYPASKKVDTNGLLKGKSLVYDCEVTNEKGMKYKNQ